MTAAVFDERVDDMARGRRVRIDGKERTIPHAQVARYEAIEASLAETFPGEGREDERAAALRAAALYLIEAPQPPESVTISVDAGASSLTAARKAVAQTARVAQDRTEAVVEVLAPFGAQLAQARAAERAAAAAARTVAVLALEEKFPEAAVSNALGVDRLTVRRWGGKKDRR